MEHSILPPSSADIWSKCSGWVVMSQSFPETEETEQQRIGTAAHEVASKYVESYARGAMYNPKIGDVTSNNVTIDDEMLECCEMYADDIRTVMVKSGAFAAPFLGVEQRLEMPEISEYSFGTSDCFIFDANNHALYVWEYKHGHDPVDVFENQQLISYAVGVLDYLKKHAPLTAEKVPSMKVIFRIVQPRSFHRDGPIREWRTDMNAVMGHVWLLNGAALANMNGGYPAVSGGHCKHCQARHGCAAALNSGAALYEVASQALPLDMTKEALGVQLSIVSTARKRLVAIEDALMQQVETLIRKGKTVPGWMTQAKNGRETWSVPIEEIHALGDMLQIDLRKQSAITPKQAVKLGIDADVIKAYTAKTTSGIEVVPEDTKTLRKIFGVTNNG